MLATRVGSAVPPPSGRAPRMNIAPRRVDNLMKHLDHYHQLFQPAFTRFEQARWARKYLEGQLLDIDRKSIEPMANALVGGNVQAMQQFISDSPWSDDEVIEIHQRLVAETLGRPDGVAILDGCDFPKQGSDSVGVARQYCGPLGKIANCQASVVLVYASEAGFTMMDRRLYLPEVWFTPDYHDRWERTGIPDDVTFRTKTELAAEMIHTVCSRGVVPIRWVTMDEGYGKSPALLQQIVDDHRWFFAEIPRITRAWRHRPKVVPPIENAVGRPQTQTHLAPDAPASQRVDDLVASLPRTAWHTFIIHEGSKGPQQIDLAAVQVVMAEDDLPGRDEWLVVRRRQAQQPITDWKFYRSNAPADVSIKTLARLTAWRWPVETVIEECKGELGLDHYEVRSWRGWHHHTTLTMLSHHFLVRERVEMGPEAPALTVSQVRHLLQVTLPKQQFDAQAVLDELAKMQQRNYAAYKSHRKRTRRQNHRTSPPK